MTHYFKFTRCHLIEIYEWPSQHSIRTPRLWDAHDIHLYTCLCVHCISIRTSFMYGRDLMSFSDRIRIHNTSIWYYKNPMYPFEYNLNCVCFHEKKSGCNVRMCVRFILRTLYKLVVESNLLESIVIVSYESYNL